MRAAVIVFPGSYCYRDLAVAFETLGGRAPVMVWHKETALPEGIDIVGIPGGFSHGDYLRCGAIAARAPICRAVVDFAARGGHVLGICNGFQVLTETGILPGALMRNAGIKFVCRSVPLEVATTNSPFTCDLQAGATIDVPVAHHDGNYYADPQTLSRLQGEDRVAFRYAQDVNGSVDRIAGVLSDNRRVLGLMPHPERAIDPMHPSTDGVGIFRSLIASMAAA